MDRKTVKTVIVTALVIVALFTAWRGVQAIKRGMAPGQAAAAYLDALIKLGQMPTTDQVRQAVTKANASASASEAKADPKQPDAKK